MIIFIFRKKYYMYNIKCLKVVFLCYEFYQYFMWPFKGNHYKLYPFVKKLLNAHTVAHVTYEYILTKYQ